MQPFFAGLALGFAIVLFWCEGECDCAKRANGAGSGKSKVFTLPGIGGCGKTPPAPDASSAGPDLSMYPASMH